MLGRVSKSGLTIVGWVLNIVMIPVVAFYLLRDWDIMVERIHALVPRSIEPVVTRLARESDEVLGAFLRGQLSVMVVLGVFYGVGLWHRRHQRRAADRHDRGPDQLRAVSRRDHRRRHGA